MERETLDRILELQLSALTTREIDGVKYFGRGFQAALPNAPDSIEVNVPDRPNEVRRCGYRDPT